MKNPFIKRATVTDAKFVSLTPSPNATEISVQIKHPESLHPIPHSVNRVDPHENIDAFREEVKRKVAGLFTNGAIDVDNMRALQQEVAGWRETWTDAAKQQAESRRKVAATLVAQISQNLEVGNAALEQSRRHRNEVFSLREQLREQLGIAAKTRDDAESLEHLLSPRTSRVSRHLNILQRTSQELPKGSVQ